jgi:hypothetical protein
MRLVSGGDGALPDGSTSNDHGLRSRVRFLRKSRETFKVWQEEASHT